MAEVHRPSASRRTRLAAWWASPASPVAVVAAAQLALHLSLNGAYGFHTDELYYVLSGRHPALGYVDFPPVTPLLAWLETSAFGLSPWTLRLLPALTSAAMVFLTGMCAIELGGRRAAAALSALVAALSLYLLATWLFQTVEFDELTWMVALYLLLRILRTGDARLFVPLGLDLGIGVETKTTILVLWVAIAVAVVVSPRLRPLLRARHAWFGLALAVGLAMPNAAWQVANGFPTLTYIANHRGDIAQAGGATSFIALFLLLIGPLVLPLWVAGMALLFRDRRFWPAAVVVALAILVFLPDGKAYYPAPTVPMVLAAGCVAAGRIAGQASRRWVAGVIIGASLVEAALLSPVILPIVPARSLHTAGLDRVNPDFANTVGWPEMTAQVAAVFNGLPPGQRRAAAILTAIDGQAGAIDVYGPRFGLPQAISPHLTFWYWKPAALKPSTLVTVGYSPRDLSFLCGSAVQVATITIPYQVVNLSQGAPILVCTDLREPLAEAWPRLRNFS